MKNTRVYKMPFSDIYPLYIQKVERKGRTQAELDEVIFWLTGHDADSLAEVIENKTDLETFFNEAPQMNPNAHLITGVICGYRVEEIDDPLMQRVRQMDKIVDELAKGKKMEKILRS